MTVPAHLGTIERAAVDVYGVLAVGVYVGVAGRPEVSHVLVPDRVAFRDELVEDLLVVDRVPGDDGVREEVGAQGLFPCSLGSRLRQGYAERVKRPGGEGVLVPKEAEQQVPAVEGCGSGRAGFVLDEGGRLAGIVGHLF